MNSKAKAVFEQLRQEIEVATEPKRFSKGEALDVLEELSGHLDASIEALREELGEDE